MANATELSQQMAANGMLDPTRNHQKKKLSDWEKMMTQLAMAQKADAKTMGGFALGKLLRQAFDSWKSNYDARGALRDKDNFGKEWNDPNAQMIYEGSPTPQSGMLNIQPNGQPQSEMLNAAANIQPQGNPAQDNLSTQWQQALQNGEQLQQLGGLSYEELLRQILASNGR